MPRPPYLDTPEATAKRIAAQRAAKQRPESIAKHRAAMQRPEVQQRRIATLRKKKEAKQKQEHTHEPIN